MAGYHGANKSEGIHFIGIGGAGMSGIAKVLLEMDYSVSGSDLKESRYTKVLADLGARVSIGHDRANLDDVGTVVISSAIPEYNGELQEARRRGLPIIPRAGMLAEVCRRHSLPIAIAGTHGKTTTTSMTALVFEKNGADPTFLIGGELNDIGSNAKHGRGGACIVEADESDGSLTHLQPELAVVTNIDGDHLDYHKSVENLVTLFSGWMATVSAKGKVIVLGDGSLAERAAREAGRAFITFGRGPENDYYYTDPDFQEFGSESTLHSRFHGRSWRLRLKVPGSHNILNALAALAAADAAGINAEAAVKTLAEFSGVKRRFQLLGTHQGVTIVDDYAHHPTEVEATLSAAKDGGWRRVICVFQPHRYSRTKMLSTEFGGAFRDADIAVLTDVYNAGEEPLPGVSGKLVVDEILSSGLGPDLAYIPNSVDVKDFLLPKVRPGDLVITMGAGDIWQSGLDLCEQLERS